MAAATADTPPQDSGSSREGGRETAEAEGDEREDTREAEAKSFSSAVVKHGANDEEGETGIGACREGENGVGEPGS